jgi:hypothetical protein
MAICGGGSPARCCQPAVAGGFIYADLTSELNTHLAPQALFTQSSPVCEPLLQAFPFPSTLEELTLHPLSQACMFIYSSHGKWVFPHLLWSFPPTTAFTSFPALACCPYAAAPASLRVCLQLTWEVGLPPSPVEFSTLRHSHKLSRSWLLGAPCHSRPLRPGPACLFTVPGRISLPLFWQRSVGPTLFATCLYCSYCLLLSFSFFPGWGSVCPGDCAVLAQCCLWEYSVLLSSPCLCLPKPSGRGLLVAWGPSWFLRLT